MPHITELYQELCRKVTAAISHPLRGVIVQVPGDAAWYAQGGSRAVSVAVTPSGAGFARQFDNVPWNNISQSDQMQGKPNLGDYVTLVFKGGSSEYPVIVAYHPGPTTAAKISVSYASRPSVPATALTAAARTPTPAPAPIPGTPK